MKGIEHFKSVIQCYLENRASYDELFAESFRKENKNIYECVTYIFNEVQKSGCSGFSDDEIYSMAVHYYDEDDIEVNHTIELTEEEKAEARQRAVEQFQREELSKIKSRNAKPKKVETTEIVSQPSLFEF